MNTPISFSRGECDIFVVMVPDIELASDRDRVDGEAADVVAVAETKW